MKSEGEEYEQSGSGNILKVVEREKFDAVMGQAEMTEREEGWLNSSLHLRGCWLLVGNIIGDSDKAMIAIQGWRPADWGKEWTQLLKVLDNPFNICHSLVTLVESTRYLGNEAPTIHLQILVMTPSLAADMLKKIAAKRPKPFRETIPKEEDNSNSKGAKIVDDKPAVRTDQSNLINTTVINNSERFDIDNNGGNQNVQDLITVEDNEEDFVRVESKRYESEGSSSEETIGEVSEEEGGEERGNEGLGNNGMNVFEPIVVTDLFYELIKRGGWKETMPSWDESGRLEASPLGQVWAGLLMGKNKFESIREVLILVGQEPKKVLVLETFNKWKESSQVRDV
ncbi:hypothetical protein PPACK8108_LOCUS25129 [Phakopsora pachyrhizi]|uniref:Uncharacterized protein n=1 Tax=Phakopsora pachyrhizi TaxID=170000 RepID=A0AAV0BRC5_PHAPC|nr:hypothetical protein PPACK8108_LOCUS25129 [Phakopsora pachyrhizi]